MNSPENATNPEAEANNPWAQVFDLLNRSALHKLELQYGRKTKERKIDQYYRYDSGLKVQITSPNVDKYLRIDFSPSRINSDTDDIRPPKGVSMAWATGDEEQMFEQVEFTLLKDQVTAYGRLMGADEDIRLQLTQTHDAARKLFDYANLAIDEGNKPHLFS